MVCAESCQLIVEMEIMASFADVIQDMRGEIGLPRTVLADTGFADVALAHNRRRITRLAAA